MFEQSERSEAALELPEFYDTHLSVPTYLGELDKNVWSHFQWNRSLPALQAESVLFTQEISIYIADS